jgi:hypothetical protein
MSTLYALVILAVLSIYASKKKREFFNHLRATNPDGVTEVFLSTTFNGHLNKRIQQKNGFSPWWSQNNPNLFKIFIQRRNIIGKYQDSETKRRLRLLTVLLILMLLVWLWLVVVGVKSFIIGVPHSC